MTARQKRLSPGPSVRAAQGSGVKLAAQHSQSLEAWFAHVPGLIVVCPSTPADFKGLLLAAIRNPNPVIFLEHKMLYFVKGDVPDGEGLTRIGVAATRREGTDVTLVSYSLMASRCLEAADLLGQFDGGLAVADCLIEGATLGQRRSKDRRRIQRWQEGEPETLAELASRDQLQVLHLERLGSPVVPGRVGVETEVYVRPDLHDQVPDRLACRDRTVLPDEAEIGAGNSNTKTEDEREQDPRRLGEFQKRRPSRNIGLSGLS